MHNFLLKTYGALRCLLARMMPIWVVLFCCLFAGGCGHRVNEDVGPGVAPAPAYSLTPQAGAAAAGPWWQGFADPLLDEVMATFLAGNFSLQQAEARLRQARLLQGQAGTRLLPELSGTVGAGSRWMSEGRHTKNQTAQLELAWEADLWRRLSSAHKALRLEAAAAEDAVQDTALLLGAQVAETYFQIVEQKLHLALLTKQIVVNETFLELIELRFANGAASVVDIYQQRQLLAAIHTQIPMVRAGLRTQQHRLQVLLGITPGQAMIAVADELPGLGPLPGLGLPADLLLHRPDLRQARQKLVAADYRVAEAIANRLPQLRLFANGGLDGSSFSGDNLFLSVVGEAVAPLLDWGRRKQEVDRQRALVEEELARYTEIFLVAIEEVENALWQEQEQLRRQEALHEQLRLATANLKETRNRYMQGLTDYLPVLTALHTLQDLERDILLSRRQLLSIRILLCRALGGAPSAAPEEEGGGPAQPAPPVPAVGAAMVHEDNEAHSL
jgi:NodT family efflux transporter outer membrane factor (OMF) lipoprotein